MSLKFTSLTFRRLRLVSGFFEKIYALFASYEYLCSSFTFYYQVSTLKLLIFITIKEN